MSSWLDLRSRAEAWQTGAVWFLRTLAFEPYAGHFLFGAWETLLADYNVTRGRIWKIVLVVTALAPWIVFWILRNTR